MFDNIFAVEKEIKKFNIENFQDLENFRLKFIAKKGKLRALFDDFKNVPPPQKKEYGSALNQLKILAESKFFETQKKLNSTEGEKLIDLDIDLTLPAATDVRGSVHPLTQVRQRFVEIFERMGFNISEGGEIETDYYNFTALNFPENHPAREMQDTYFIEKNPDFLLRTHTSSVQIRLMESEKPPFRTIMPGRVYRNEAISARAHCFFNQMEGLYVDKNVSFKNMKDTLYHFAKEMYGQHTQIRLRPSYFPFTEPSAELDISCQICKQKGCNVCKGSGWVEIGGCGMVDPNVFEACDINSNEFSGFAFGMGIERIAMLKYQINDLRTFSENDIRFLRQF